MSDGYHERLGQVRGTGQPIGPRPMREAADLPVVSEEQLHELRNLGVELAQGPIVGAGPALGAQP